MKTNKKHFELFQTECKRWIERFQLNDYDIYFEWKELEENDANSYIHGADGNITFALGKEVGNFDRVIEECIKDLAKHEVLHCLLGRYSSLAEKRYISIEELISEEEHLVRKLCNIIN